MASVRSSPTLNWTVTTAMPGRETEKTCSMPFISESTCSAGPATRCSISVGEAPGTGMKTSAKVTLICGSSSRGVTRMAKNPSSSPTRASSGVMAVSWKRAATLPEMPSGLGTSVPRDRR